ncbi:MAG: hypothetical protein LUD79_08330 [Oscillospiraceae bacterium]|nr:hypothetical protein [Oscillospiraceae bacterium]
MEDRQQARHLARCSQCGGELYAWERVYYLEGEYICPDCLGDYARARFAPYLAPLSDWRERKI